MPYPTDSNHASDIDCKIVGIEPSAGMMGLLKDKVLKEYGLENSYDVVDGSTPAMLARSASGCGTSPSRRSS